METLHELGLAETGARLRRGELSAVALCEHYLERIRHLDPTLGALRLRTEARALASAEAAASLFDAGVDLGPLQGIPYVTKDLFDVAGLVTTAGSRVHEERVAAQDATVTRRLAAGGAVLLGKTNTVEFAFGSIGINHSHGTPWNPWSSTHHVPGGSSSGSAVAVAAGLAAVATGTDTACSVRTPAALCGIVGLKTTVGRVSRAGVHPLSATLDSVGPLARRVEDAALMFDALQGEDTGDSTTVGVRSLDVLTTLRAGVRGLRVGVAEGWLFEEVEPAVERAVREAAQVLADLGAVVSSVEFTEAAEVMSRPSPVSMVEGYAVNGAFIESQPELLDPVVRDRMAPGGDIPAVAYRRALDDLEPLRASAARRFDQFDVLLGPTCPLAAAPVEAVDQGFDTYMDFGRRYLQNCFPGNLLRLCGISVPCGFTEQGLPIGLMLYGAPFREDMVLRVAQAFEDATAWHRQQPDLSWIDAP